MHEGLIAELSSLIALKRWAKRAQTRGLAKASMSGNRISALRGRGMQFSELRHYQAGDEIRHMEWRVTARTGKPHIKLYTEERERPVMLLTDFNPSMAFGSRVAFKSVVAAKLSALIAWTSIKEGDKVGALLFSAKSHHEFTPRAREAGILPLLSTMSDYTKLLIEDTSALKPRALSEELLRLRRVTKPGTVLVLISDFYLLDEDSLQQLGRLREKNAILAYRIIDPLEAHPPKPGLYPISNGLDSILIDMHNLNARKNYQAWCEDTKAYLSAQFKRLKIPYTELSAEDDLALVVKRTFSRQAGY